MMLNYMFDTTLCAVINVDFSTKSVHVKYYLKRLGLDFYDLLDIVRKTNGRVYGDKFWIEFVSDSEMEVLHE